MFEEALEEHAPGGGDPGCAAFTPARGSSGRTCHRYPNADVITEKHTRVVTFQRTGKSVGLTRAPLVRSNRKRVVKGRCGLVGVDYGVRRIIKKKKNKEA